MKILTVNAQDNLTEEPIPTNTVDALRHSILERLTYSVGKDLESATKRDWMFAVFHAVRDRIVKRWRETMQHSREQNAKRVYYLSMEFLIGRTLSNALVALDSGRHASAGAARSWARTRGRDRSEADAGARQRRPGPAGRVLPGFDGHARPAVLRLRHPLRVRHVRAGHRRTAARSSTPTPGWPTARRGSFRAPACSYPVRFGGHVEHSSDQARWRHGGEVDAKAYDMVVPGHGTRRVSTLRLWTAPRHRRTSTCMPSTAATTRAPPR